MATTINASTSNGLIQTADTSGVLALQANGTTILQANSASATGLLGGIIQPYQYYQLNTTVVGSNATGAQSILNVGVTLAASTIYEFECLYMFSKSAGATYHNFQIGFGGSATLNNINYAYILGFSNSAFLVNTGSSNNYTGTIQTASATTINTGVASAAYFNTIVLKGTISVNASGTFIPQYTLSAAPGGAYTTQIGSYFKISPLASSGANVNIGTWS